MGIISRSDIVLIAIVLLAGGCALLPWDRLIEANQSLPEIRAYALAHLNDLSPGQREIIQSHQPKLGHANFESYYFWWQDDTGKTFATVEASPPPCKPYRAWRNDDK